MTLVAEVCCSLEVQSCVAPYFLALPEDVCRLFFVSNRSCWSRQLYFEARVREHETMSEEGQNDELFSMRTVEMAG